MSRSSLFCGIIVALVTLGLLPPGASAVPPAFRPCQAIDVGGTGGSPGGVRIFSSAEAYAEQLRQPRDSVAYSTGVSGVGAGCSVVWELLRQVLPRHGEAEAQALVSAGFTPVHVEQLDSERAGFTHYAVVAVGFGFTVRYFRTGGAPDVYAVNAGEQLYFTRQFDAGSLSDASKCTSAFSVQFGDGALGQLGAGHCGWEQRHLRRDIRRGVVSRDHAGLPFSFLSRVRRNLDISGRLDALAFEVAPAPGLRITRLIARGLGVPVRVIDAVGTGDLDAGDRVCFYGVRSGEDCGVLRRGVGGKVFNGLARVFGGDRAVCTTATARAGDSGAPVYTRPTAGGTVRAVGIVQLKVGAGVRSSMCFTPLRPVLDALGARIAPGVANGPIVA